MIWLRYNTWKFAKFKWRTNIFLHPLIQTLLRTNTRILYESVRVIMVQLESKISIWNMIWSSKKLSNQSGIRKTCGLFVTMAIIVSIMKWISLLYVFIIENWIHYSHDRSLGNTENIFNFVKWSILFKIWTQYWHLCTQ